MTTTERDKYLAARERTEAVIREERERLDRLAWGLLDEQERLKLRQEFRAPSDDQLRAHLEQRLQNHRVHLELLEERTPAPPKGKPNLEQIARGARKEAERLKQVRARLAWAVLIGGQTARMQDLEEIEQRITDKLLLAERAEIARKGA